jgi:hypothetical protein
MVFSHLPSNLILAAVAFAQLATAIVPCSPASRSPRWMPHQADVCRCCRRLPRSGPCGVAYKPRHVARPTRAASPAAHSSRGSARPSSLQARSRARLRHRASHSSAPSPWKAERRLGFSPARCSG